MKNNFISYSFITKNINNLYPENINVIVEKITIILFMKEHCSMVFLLMLQ